jgi:hypothetical protein
MARGNKGNPKQTVYGKATGRVGGLPPHALIKGKATLSGQPIPNETKAQNPRNWTNPRPIPGGAPPAVKAKGKPGY